MSDEQEHSFNHTESYGNKLKISPINHGVVISIRHVWNEDDLRTTLIPYSRFGDLIDFLVELRYNGRVPQAGDEEEYYFVGGNGDEPHQIYFSMSDAVASEPAYIDIFNKDGKHVRALKRDIDDEEGVDGMYKYTDFF